MGSAPPLSFPQTSGSREYSYTHMNIHGGNEVPPLYPLDLGPSVTFPDSPQPVSPLTGIVWPPDGGLWSKETPAWKGSLVWSGEPGSHLRAGLNPRPRVRASPSLGLSFPSDLQGPSGPERVQPGSRPQEQTISLIPCPESSFVWRETRRLRFPEGGPGQAWVPCNQRGLGSGVPAALHTCSQVLLSWGSLGTGKVGVGLGPSRGGCRCGRGGNAAVGGRE